MRRLFVTIFMARSGSKFLASLLNNHPDVKDFGEAFHNREKWVEEPSDVYRKLASLLMARERVCGFQYRYMRHVKEFPEIQQFLETNARDTYVIFLQRRNKLKGAISQQNSERWKRETGKAHKFKDQAELGALTLDVERAIKETRDRERLDAQFRAWIVERFPFYALDYEDLVADPLRRTNEVFRFLGVAPFKDNYSFSSNLVKVTPDDLSQAIANYDELRERLERDGLTDWLSADAPAPEPDETPVSFASRKDKARKAAPREVFQRSFADTPRPGERLDLSVSAFKMRTRSAFLEHVEPGILGDEAAVIAIDGDLLLQADNNGRKWHAVRVRRPYMKCFTLRSGRHLLQEKDGDIDLYDREWAFLGKARAGEHPWHGAWSIDENPETGTILWCEYPYAADRVHVWRSRDQGQSWDVAFAEHGDASSPKGGNIRHFHLCQHCTTTPGRWYLASGDTEQQSRFWVSEDDGDSWREIAIAHVSGAPEGFPTALQQRLFRFTAMVQTPDRLIFATDDTFQGLGSLVVAMDKQNLGRLQVFEGICGHNESRNLIRIADDLALVVSESKLDRTQADVSLADFRTHQVHRLAGLPNAEELKSNFMNSLSSKRAIDGVFYSFSDNVIFRPSTRILRWRISRQPAASGGARGLAGLLGR